MALLLICSDSFCERHASSKLSEAILAPASFGPVNALACGKDLTPEWNPRRYEDTAIGKTARAFGTFNIPTLPLEYFSAMNELQ